MCNSAPSNGDSGPPPSYMAAPVAILVPWVPREPLSWLPYALPTRALKMIAELRWHVCKGARSVVTGSLVPLESTGRVTGFILCQRKGALHTRHDCACLDIKCQFFNVSTIRVDQTENLPNNHQYEPQRSAPQYSLFGHVVTASWLAGQILLPPHSMRSNIRCECG